MLLLPKITQQRQQRLIYYPGFEVQNQDWLKFAMLYLNRIEPIIPNTGDKHLSQWYHKLMYETDLIEVYRPSDNDGFSATLDAIGEIEKILRNPDLYQEIFKKPNILQEWKDPKKWTVQLFEEKYSWYFSNFCCSNNLGKENSVGLLLHQDVTRLYMTILSQAIADREGASPITDDPLLDRFSIFTRKQDFASEATIKAAQCVLNLKLPANLNSLSLSDIIRHRNKPGFKEKQNAFHLELHNFLSGVETGKPEEFAQSLGSLWSDFSEDILEVGAGTTAFGIGIWIFLQAPIVALQGLKEIVGGLPLIVSGSIAIKNTWENTQTRRLSRRFLADLSSLNSATL